MQDILLLSILWCQCGLSLCLILHEKRIVGGVCKESTCGFTHASLPFFFESQNELTKGICAPQAGLGHVTVRAQSQAITVASPPPYSFGNVTLG